MNDEDKTKEQLILELAELRGRAEAALQESDERFKYLAESMTQMVWITDDRGNSVYHNPRFVEYTGLETSTMADRCRLIHPDDLRIFLNDWQDCLRTGMDSFLSRFRWRGRNGQYRWFFGGTVIRRNAENDPFPAYASTTDFDDLMRAKEALKENLAILDNAESIAHTGSRKREPAANRDTWSSGLFRIFGVPESEEASFTKYESLLHHERNEDGERHGVGSSHLLLHPEEAWRPYYGQFDGRLEHHRNRIPSGEADRRRSRGMIGRRPHRADAMACLRIVRPFTGCAGRPSS